MPFVYILHCRDGSLYTGATRNLARRLSEHQAGSASKYTRARRPVALAWSFAVRTWRRALQLEIRIKQLARGAKLELISGSRSLPSRRSAPRRREPRRRPRRSTM